jgi:glycosyltransferase involved in cell wall biosynthesis
VESLEHILYLSYHYFPDLSAGSFRNSALSKELSRKLENKATIHLICTQPNRYSNLNEKLPAIQQAGNLIIYRVEVPQHGNNFVLQLWSYYAFQRQVLKIIGRLPINFIFVSTSKLFTGYLAYRISKQKVIPYYLDLRDLFAENLRELIKIPVLNASISKCIQVLFEKPVLINAKHININSAGFRKNIPESYQGTTSFFPNGIDDEFTDWEQDADLDSAKKIICYAGNIGEGQGLDKIIPELAKALETTHHFRIIGEGSSKHKLVRKIEKYRLTNIELLPAMKRHQLLSYYQRSHYLFLHLNDFRSFEKVIPSKIFEYGSGNIPILAGVKGYAKNFIETELKENVFVFNPCDVDSISNYLLNHVYHLQKRPEFNAKFNRKEITGNMSDSIIQVMNLKNAQA